MQRATLNYWVQKLANYLILELLQGLLNEVDHGCDVAAALVPRRNDRVLKLLQLRVILEALQVEQPT